MSRTTLVTTCRSILPIRSEFHGPGSRVWLGYATGTGACGTVCQNSGSWPKKMRAPLCSSASKRSREASMAARATSLCRSRSS